MNILQHSKMKKKTDTYGRRSENTDNNEPLSPSKQSDTASGPYQGTKYIDEGPASVLRQYIASGNRSPIEILDEIKRIALARSLDNDKTMKVMFEGLCRLDDYEKFIESLKKYAKIIATFTKTVKDSQIFFSCLEEILARRNKNLLPKTYWILNALYDCDIVTEDQILNWYHSQGKNSIIEKDELEDIRENAKPFVNWLEEEEDDDNDNNDENEHDKNNEKNKNDTNQND